MTDLDTMLRESLGRLAEPADPSGVAAAIQARVDATGASDGGAGGTGAGGSGFSAWVIPAVIGLAAIGGGLALGAATSSAGATGTSGSEPFTLAEGGGIPAALCPGGVTVVHLDPGARVLALSRSDDGTFLAVRDPGDLNRVVWVSSGLTEPDPGSDVAALPVAGCDEASSAPSAEPSVTPSATPSAEPTETNEPEPEPEPTSTSKPTKKPTPKPTPVNDPPAMTLGSWSSSVIAGSGDPGDQFCTDPQSATINVTATDDGTVSLTGTTDYGPDSLTQMSHQGSTWTFKYVANYGANAGPITVKVTFTATDDAGKTTKKSKNISVASSGNQCVG